MCPKDPAQANGNRSHKVDTNGESLYVKFPRLPDDAVRDGQPVLNKYSTFLTREHDYPGAQAMLYAAGVPDEKSMKNSPHVGIASVWWEGNPCKCVSRDPLGDQELKCC